MLLIVNTLLTGVASIMATGALATMGYIANMVVEDQKILIRVEERLNEVREEIPKLHKTDEQLLERLQRLESKRVRGQTP